MIFITLSNDSLKHLVTRNHGTNKLNMLLLEILLSLGWGKNFIAYSDLNFIVS